ncbi:MAG: hypothetical protein QMD80_06435 [archaeon]|nr:hypothetical protein [archaeon]
MKVTKAIERTVEVQRGIDEVLWNVSSSETMEFRTHNASLDILA